MILSKEAKRRVRKALVQKITVQELQSPLEYHYFAWHWNWDKGIKPLEWIIQQPDCDRGTALLIYWYASPTWYGQYRDRKEVRASGGNLRHYDFIKEIERRVGEGFYTTQTIHFLPHNDSGYDWTAEHIDKPVKSPIPAYMLQPSPGVELRKNALSAFVQRDLTTSEEDEISRDIASGFEVLCAAIPEVSDLSSPGVIVTAIGDYVTLERERIGKRVRFTGPQAKVGWVLAKQIERQYGWIWQIYSFDDGDTERLAVMSPDNVLIAVPPNIVVLSIKRPASENAIGRFFDLLGTYTGTQDFSEFYALNWMTFVRR
ncbi:MAG: DUF4274 domain-containing protein [Anaerolineae bacterium]